MRYADILYLQQLETAKQMEAHRQSVKEKFQQIAQRERELLEAVEARPKVVDGVVYTAMVVHEKSFSYYEDEEDDDGGHA